ncbi:hypothetical protein C0991_002005 [Blastosporella zonata]|nr:hypothetical protein C0991_002005 [Blastosporella zonata]
MSSDRDAYVAQVSLLQSLLPKLPKSIPAATTTDRINEVFSNIPVGSKESWVVYNHRFDALFGEDTCNKTGRLANFLRGPFGMNLVIAYLQTTLNDTGLLWIPAQIKNMRKATASQTKKKGKGKKRRLDVNTESDGESALCDLKSKEASQGARRGPANESMAYFHEPVQILDASGKTRWEFKYRHCKTVRTFPRTVGGKNMTFDDEPVLPKLNNLASHASECKRKCSNHSDEEDKVAKSTFQTNLKASAEMMEAYLCKGELNPARVPTQKGFLWIFSAWILDESLSWTTGEAPTLRMLFKYIHANFTLSSDTAVRNQLAHIFSEIHGKII